MLKNAQRVGEEKRAWWIIGDRPALLEGWRRTRFWGDISRVRFPCSYYLPRPLSKHTQPTYHMPIVHGVPLHRLCTLKPFHSGLLMFGICHAQCLFPSSSPVSFCPAFNGQVSLCVFLHWYFLAGNTHTILGQCPALTKTSCHTPTHTCLVDALSRPIQALWANVQISTNDNHLDFKDI